MGRYAPRLSEDVQKPREGRPRDHRVVPRTKKDPAGHNPNWFIRAPLLFRERGCADWPSTKNATARGAGEQRCPGLFGPMSPSKLASETSAPHEQRTHPRHTNGSKGKHCRQLCFLTHFSKISSKCHPPLRRKASAKFSKGLLKSFRQREPPRGSVPRTLAVSAAQARYPPRSSC